MDITWANDTPLAKRIQAQSQLIATKVNRHFCDMKTNALCIQKQTKKLLWRTNNFRTHAMNTYTKQEKQ